MEWQLGFNVAVTVIGFLCGWVLNTVTKRIDELKDSDHNLRNKVQAIEVLVAGQYAKKDDLDRMSNAIFVKLDKIDSKLDSKQDKE